MGRLKRTNVLDHGYVILHQTLGDDLTVVNAARVSFDKRKAVLDDKDKRLINFLAEHDHTSPFRHAMLQFEVYAPLMVARQWYKYTIGSDHVMDAWNESSRRYVTEEPVFYQPEKWRGAAADRKQGSEGVAGPFTNKSLSKRLQAVIDDGLEQYHAALDLDVTPEQARLFLPAYAMYVRWYWTASLQSVAHLLRQRLAADAQWEFQQYAHAVYELVKSRFPIALNALVEEGNK